MFKSVIVWENRRQELDYMRALRFIQSIFDIRKVQFTFEQGGGLKKKVDSFGINKNNKLDQFETEVG